jgi:hypothetical protein
VKTAMTGVERGTQAGRQAAAHFLDCSTMPSPWDHTRAELDRWASQGLKASFWVRDDDAIETSPQLTRLHALAINHDISIGLAIIPAQLDPSLPPYIKNQGHRFYPMCHGWTHANHAEAGRRPAEFGADRPMNMLVSEARLAYRTFSSHFGERGIVFVPPFGRISKPLVRALPELGFSGVSAAAGWLERRLSRLSDWNVRFPIAAAQPWSCVPRLDVHIDPINWRTRTAHHPAIISQALVRCLRARRNGWLDVNRPIGLVTHHRDHDESIWQVCDALLQVVRPHPAVQFLHADQFFGRTPAAVH